MWTVCVCVCDGCLLSSQMYYYRYENAEVSCCYKYLMFSYNIIFWVSQLTLLSACILSDAVLLSMTTHT